MVLLYVHIRGAIHERLSHVRYDIGRTTVVVATIRPIHESSRKNKRIVRTIRPARGHRNVTVYISIRGRIQCFYL